jgi:hypothetical protein
VCDLLPATITATTTILIAITTIHWVQAFARYSVEETVIVTAVAVTVLLLQMTGLHVPIIHHLRPLLLGHPAAVEAVEEVKEAVAVVAVVV